LSDALSWPLRKTGSSIKRADDAIFGDCKFYRPYDVVSAKSGWLVSSEMTAADYERLREQTLDEMVAAGEITEQQRDKVFFVRFLAADEVEYREMDRQSRGARPARGERCFPLVPTKS
jgi:hypothetical protein